MNVRLVIQVFSKSVAKILQEYYAQELHGRAELCEKIDKFFDWTYETNKKVWSNANLSYNPTKVLVMKDFIGWKM